MCFIGCVIVLNTKMEIVYHIRIQTGLVLYLGVVGVCGLHPCVCARAACSAYGGARARTHARTPTFFACRVFYKNTVSVLFRQQAWLFFYPRALVLGFFVSHCQPFFSHLLILPLSGAVRGNV